METIEAIDRIHQDLKALNLATFELKEVNRLIERAFRAGKAEQADPLAGYSNLTAAISAGEPIDWAQLDGLKVQCVNPELGTLHGTLKRNKSYLPELFHGWDDNTNLIYSRAFCHSWLGLHGWTLWVEGEVPLRRKTADQLETGHFFTGTLSDKSGEWGEHIMCVVGEPGTGNHIRYAADFMPSEYPASEWVVIEEYGTFQKPEGK